MMDVTRRRYYYWGRQPPNCVDASFARGQSGASAVEFALIAPVMVACLLAMVDVGLAINTRMSMDAVLRSGAQVAMADPGAEELHQALLSLSEGEDFTVAVALHCPCPDEPQCSTPCTDSTVYTTYRLSAEGLYHSMITPLEIELNSAVEVQVK